MEDWKEEIIEYGSLFKNVDFKKFYLALLDKINHSLPLEEETLYATLEKGNYVGQYYSLKLSNATKKEWMKFIKEHPFYGKPIGEQFDEKSENVELAQEIFKRNLRMYEADKYYKLPIYASRVLIANKIKDQPYSGFAKRIHELCGEDEFADYKGAEGFFELGEYYYKSKDYLLAITAFENALFQKVSEDGAYYKEAFEMIAKCAVELPESDYKIFLLNLDKGSEEE